MLRNLHVKNLALIREADIDFSEGLTVLTGETGAGKSILIGSLLLALGGRLSKEMQKEGTSSLVEAVFETERPETEEALKKLDIEPSDGMIILSRRIENGRSYFRINGETVTAQKVRACGECLIDIHGQHENQTLMKNEEQLRLLDEYGSRKIAPLKEAVREAYTDYRAMEAEMSESGLSEEERRRRMDFLSFEINELEEASLKVGEDDELESLYRKLSHVRRIAEAAENVRNLMGGEQGAADQAGCAVRLLDEALRYDEELDDLAQTAHQIEDLLNDFNSELASYTDNLETDPQVFAETEERLNTINRMKAKYGRTIEDVLEALQERRRSLEELEDYEEVLRSRQRRFEEAETKLKEATAALSYARQEIAPLFEKEASAHFLDLNFARADFRLDFSAKNDYTSNGRDEVEYMIATNPGEPVLPLKTVASGGELSRIMLGIRTMFADKDQTETLIFDEIDAGISGRTAQKVAEKLQLVAKKHQTFCITHLPQIAAMGDNHYCIRKEISDHETVTRIEALSQEEAVDELARLLGGAKITDITYQAASDMKKMAMQIKERNE